jgi:hypothetical protein
VDCKAFAAFAIDASHIGVAGLEEELVTSPNDQRIDRPLLPDGRSSDRSPDGWCPAHLARPVSMAMPVSTTI